MDARTFDDLARSVRAPGSRRRLLGLLAAVPMLGGLLILVGQEETTARDRRKRRKNRHRKRHDPGKHKKKGCRSKSKAKICAGACGTVKSRKTCGKSVDCGSCACDPACSACLVCDPTTRTCVPDAAQVGQPCGSVGQICGTDGACRCTPKTCPADANCGTIDDGCGQIIRCGPDLCAQPDDPCQEALCQTNVCTTGPGHDGAVCEAGPADNPCLTRTCQNGSCNLICADCNLCLNLIGGGTQCVASGVGNCTGPCSAQGNCASEEVCTVNAVISSDGSTVEIQCPGSSEAWCVLISSCT